MEVLSREETALWCQRHEIALNHRGLPELSDAAAKFKIPEDAQKRVALVSQAMRVFRDAPLFLVWFTEWHVWQSGERMHIFDRFRMSYGEKRPLIQSPGHILHQAEMDDAVSLVTLGVLFLWDCYVVTPNRANLVFFSHDEFGLTKGAEAKTSDDL
jgi:hypothetical protein